MSFLPLDQTFPNIIRVKAQDAANALEIENPTPAWREKPDLHRLEKSPPVSMLCGAMLLETVERIFQYGEHESLLGQDKRIATATAEKFFHRKRVILILGPAVFSCTAKSLIRDIRRERGFKFHASTLGLQSRCIGKSAVPCAQTDRWLSIYRNYAAPDRLISHA